MQTVHYLSFFPSFLSFFAVLSLVLSLVFLSFFESLDGRECEVVASPNGVEPVASLALEPETG